MSDAISGEAQTPDARSLPSPKWPKLSPLMAQQRDAFIIGALVTVALLGAQYVTRASLKLAVFVPRTFAELLADVFNVNLTVSAGGVLFFDLIGIAVFVLIGGGLAVLYARIRMRGLRRGLLGGIVIGVVAFALSIPLEAGRGWTLSSGLVLLALSLLWGLALDQTMSGAAARPAVTADTDSPLLTRDLFLLQTAAGALLVATLCIPTAWIIEGRQIPLPKIVFGPPTPTPIPRDQFF